MRSRLLSVIIFWRYCSVTFELIVFRRSVTAAATGRDTCSSSDHCSGILSLFTADDENAYDHIRSPSISNV